MKKNKKETCCETGKEQGSCCTVTAIVSVDEKGQLVLPKDLRKQLNLKPGDKLAIISMSQEGSTCCLMMMKANELNGMVKIKIDKVLHDKEN